jgi:hypothetical protein
MNNYVIRTNPGNTSKRYPVTQEQIDDVLNNELKDYSFPVKPVYNPRIRSNGRTIADIYPWGQLKSIKSIEIGRQDMPDRSFLIDTLLHEFFEVEIFQKQYTDDFYKSLNNSGDEKRHKWIIDQIVEALKK